MTYWFMLQTRRLSFSLSHTHAYTLRTSFVEDEIKKKNNVDKMQAINYMQSKWKIFMI